MSAVTFALSNEGKELLATCKLIKMHGKGRLSVKCTGNNERVLLSAAGQHNALKHWANIGRDEYQYILSELGLERDHRYAEPIYYL